MKAISCSRVVDWYRQRPMNGHKRLLWGALGAAALATVSVADSKGFRRYLLLRQEINGFGERNRQLEEANRVLVKEINALRDDPRALERAAREELGFIKPGEMVLNLE